MLKRIILLVLASVLLMAPLAMADVPGNPDLRPSLSLLAGVGGYAGKTDTYGWSSTLTLPVASNLTWLLVYRHDSANSWGGSVLEGGGNLITANYRSWDARVGFKVYF